MPTGRVWTILHSLCGLVIIWFTKSVGHIFRNEINIINMVLQKDCLLGVHIEYSCNPSNTIINQDKSFQESAY